MIFSFFICIIILGREYNYTNKRNICNNIPNYKFNKNGDEWR